MSRLLWLVVFVCSFLPITGYALGRNVIYSQQEREDQSSIFLDRAGDLYPPHDVYVDPERMVGHGVPSREVNGKNVATLRAHFSREAQAGSTAWIDILRASGVTDSGNFDRDWDRIQAALRERVIARLKGYRGHEVLMVVHGFNNTHGRANKGWMDEFASKIHQRRPDTRIVRVYWDGLTGNKAGIGIWGKAQFNGPRVGQQLRRILNQIGSDLTLRIFTHSSGAYVVTNALGDGGGSYGRFKDNKVLQERAGSTEGEYAIPNNLTDLRVAMLIPAQPWTAFNEYKGGEKGVIPDRLILGTARRDFATSKWILPCTRFGNTCMAVRPEKACAEVRKALHTGAPRYRSAVVVVDFPTPPGRRYHDHGAAEYMKDALQWEELMQQLFEDDPPKPQRQIRGCKV